MTTTNKANAKTSKDATAEALLQHDYAMDATNAGPDKRSNEELDDSPASTPSKASHVRKWVRPNEDSSFECIMSAIQTLGMRFDKQEKKLEDINTQIKENSTMISSLSRALEFNAAEVKECKSKVSKLEEKVTKLEKEKRRPERESGPGKVQQA